MKVIATAATTIRATRTLRDRIAVSYCITVASRGLFDIRGCSALTATSAHCSPYAARPDWPYGIRMTEESYAIDAGHPPSAVLNILNPVLGFLLRSPLARLAGMSMQLSRFSRRKLG